MAALDLASGKTLATIKLFTLTGVDALMVRPDGRVVAGAQGGVWGRYRVPPDLTWYDSANAHYIRIVDRSLQHIEQEVPASAQRHTYCLAPLDNYLVFGGDASDLKVLDLASLRPAQSIRLGPDQLILGCSVSRDHREIAVASRSVVLFLQI